MKKIKKTAIVIGITFTILVMIPVIILSLSPVQRAIGAYATDFLSDFVGAKFSISSVKIHHLTRIDINSVYVEDRQHAKMFYLGSLKAHFRLFPLLHKEISVKKIVIQDFDANLYYLPDSTMNLQFLIDAFTPKEKKGVPDLELPQIILSNANIDYRDWRNGTEYHIRDFSTDVKFSLRNKSWINLEIASLQLSDEHSKRIENIQFKFNNNDKTLNVSNLIVDLPNSHLFLKKAIVTIEKNEDNTIDWDESSYDINIAPSHIVLSDLDWLLPRFHSLNKPINLQVVAKGKINNFNTKTIKVDYNKEIVLDASIRTSNITDIAASNSLINFNKLQFSAKSVSCLISDFTKKHINLPKELDNVGTCTYSGQIAGNPFDLTLIGRLETAVGSISTNVKLQTPDTFHSAAITGLVQTSNISLQAILPNPALGLGNVQFAVNTTARFYKDHNYEIDVAGNIKHLTFKNYAYNNIKIDGTIKPKMFEGALNIDDPNGHLDFTGTCDLYNDKKVFNFNAEIDGLSPNRLNLIKTYPDLSLSCKISSNLSAKSLMTSNGNLDIDSLVIINADKQYNLSNLSIVTTNDVDTNYIDISSSLINGSIYGKFDINDILGNVINTLSKDLHILGNLNVKQPKAPVAIAASFEVAPLKSLMNVLDIPWFTTTPSNLHVSYNSTNSRFSSYIALPRLTNGTTFIDSTFLNVNNYRGVSVRLSTTTNIKMGHLSTQVNLRALNDTISSSLIWSNTNSSNIPFGGELYAKTRLAVSDGHLNSSTNILPTQFILNNTLWQVASSSFSTSKDKVSIKDFSLSSDDGQLISATGDISDDQSSKVSLNISNLLLDYISDMLPEKVSLSFGGQVSADGEISKLTSETPRINANVRSDNFSFNHTLYGSVDGHCRFDKVNNGLEFFAKVFNPNDTVAALKGNYLFKNKYLDIVGKANGMDISFLDYYLGKSFATVKGKASGDVHIYGSNKMIAIDVDALARDAALRVNFLGSSFHFTDSIHMDKDVIDFGSIDLTDDNGKHGRLTGKITHNYLKDMGFDLALQFDTMLVMNTTRKESPSFFGKVLAFGNIFIGGNDKEITITGKASTVPGTNITLPLDNYTANENSFITFCDPVSVPKDLSSTKQTPDKNGSNLVVDLGLDICPETEASLIINSKSGDQLNAKAGGSLRFAYDVNADNMKMYGNLEVMQAKYLFSLQEVIRKEFIIKQGGTISWNGDIMSAELDLDGSYRLNADLAELLDASVLTNVSRTTVPVECLIDITGNLTQPSIGFSIYLPNSEEELNRAVQNTINTPEMLNREVIALLLMGKFIKPETMNNNSFLSQNELYAVVSSTISAQINNWASQMFDKWGFGVNFTTAGEGASRQNDYEFNFQYSPTSRLIINGNVGYRDNSTSTNNFIGDFDIEYKIIPSGKLRIKGYTHTNDYKEFKKGLTTQGVGLVWSESFLNAKDLRDSWKANHERSKRERAERKTVQQKKKEEKKAKKEEKKRLKEAKKEKRK